MSYAGARMRPAAFVLFVSLTAPFAAPAATAQSVDRHVAQINQQLVDVVSRPMETDVVPAAKALLPQLKDAIAQSVDRYMMAQSPQAQAASVERGLHALLPKVQEESRPIAGDNDWDRPVHGLFGGVSWISVTQPVAGLLFVQVSIRITCGDDTVLLVYKHENSVWRRILRWQSKPYDKDSGAFGDAYSTLVLQQEPKLKLAVVHGHPWCTSVWSGFNIDVIEQSASIDAPREVWNYEHGYIRDDSDLTLRRVAGGFQIKPLTGSVDAGILWKQTIMRFQMDGDRVVRLQPIAPNGRSFVDEWIQSPWSDAKNWSSSSEKQSLEKEHATLLEKLKKQFFEFGAVRGCSDSPKHFQVEMSVESESSIKGKTLFFQIEQQSNGFMMLSIFHRASSTCNGPDVMRPVVR